MTPPANRLAVIGGGIVGLTLARQLLRERPGVALDLYEKERRPALHQTGHNSGVVHAGLYYAPGSLKARLCRRGGALLREYAAERRIPLEEVGKVVIARSSGELAALERIGDRAAANGVPGLERLGPAGLADVEPHAVGVAALHSPTTAVVDFARVAAEVAGEVTSLGGRVRLGCRVQTVRPVPRGVEVVTDTAVEHYGAAVVCAGLGTDLLRRSDQLRILPFRGHYHALVPTAAGLVRGLIYPVPDPRYPFLGIHLTRKVDGGVLVGPNALAALAREGYHWSDVDVRAVGEWLRWPGSWGLARRHWRTGAEELVASLSRRVFAGAARSYVPAIADDDLVPAAAGVRAQAVDRSGALVDDFAIDNADGLVVVRNAPSPAATSSFAIAEHLAALVP